MAGSRLLLLLLACVVGVAMAGPPLPGFSDLPTESYGPTPPCYLNGVVVKCEWYGWAHLDYPVDGKTCLAVTRVILANTTRVPPGTLLPNVYYSLELFIFNTTTNETYCHYGCFDLTTTATPPPATVATPPPGTVAAPPPLTFTAPPPGSSALVPPPAALLPPPTTNAPDTLAPATATPPPPPFNPRVVIAGAGFLQPRGIVSFVISGALLVLHGILGF